MSTKQFMQGMIKGAEPFDKKFNQQGEKVDEIANFLHQKIDLISTNVDNVIDIAEEHDQKLKNLNNGIKIKDRNSIDDLNSDERNILVGFIGTLCKTLPTGVGFNDDQKKYISSILKYFKLSEPSMEVPLKAIESIENLNKQKVILKVIMKIIFLEDRSFDCLENFKDVMNSFSINQSGVNQIKEDIFALYNLVGTKGIIDWYIQQDDTNISSLPSDCNEIKSCSEKADFFVSDNLGIEVGESRTIQNMVVHIQNTILIDGELRFIDCDINFDCKCVMAFDVQRNGKLLFEGCNISSIQPCLNSTIYAEQTEIIFERCNFYDCSSISQDDLNNIEFKGYNELSFIKIKDSKITFTRCKFNKCVNTIIDETNSKLIFDDCVVNNQRGSFLKIQCGEVFIKNSSFVENRYIIKGQGALISGSCEDAILDGCSFNGSDENDNIKVIDMHSGKICINNCKFTDLIIIGKIYIPIPPAGSVCFFDSEDILPIADFRNGFMSIEVNIKNSVFSNSSGIWTRENLSVENSTFDKCKGEILRGQNMVLNICKFIDCINDTINDDNIKTYDKIVKNGFGYGMDSILNIVKSNSNVQSTNVENCIFLGCESYRSIIKVRSSDNKVIAHVRDCLFENCKTRNNLFFDGEESEKGLLKKSTFKYYSEYNNKITNN